MLLRDVPHDDGALRRAAEAADPGLEPAASVGVLQVVFEAGESVAIQRGPDVRREGRRGVRREDVADAFPEKRFRRKVQVRRALRAVVPDRSVRVYQKEEVGNDAEDRLENAFLPLYLLLLRADHRLGVDDIADIRGDDDPARLSGVADVLRSRLRHGVRSVLSQEDPRAGDPGVPVYGGRRPDDPFTVAFVEKIGKPHRQRRRFVVPVPFRERPVDRDDFEGSAHVDEHRGGTQVEQDMERRFRPGPESRFVDHALSSSLA